MCGVLVDRQNHGILPYWFNQSVTSKASKTVRVLSLVKPVKSQVSDFQTGVTRPKDLDPQNKEDYKWEYNEWRVEHLEWIRLSKAMRDLNTDIIRTVAKKNLHLLKDKTTPYDRLVTLRTHLAPTDATRRRELAGKYASLRTPPRGKKVEEWLRSWLDIITQSREAELPEMSGTRAQEDFLVACKQIDDNFATSALRELYHLESVGREEDTPSVEVYVSEFTNYLRRTKRLQRGLGAYAAELEVATTPQKATTTNSGLPLELRPCLCGQVHRWVDCPYVNKDLQKRKPEWRGQPDEVARVKKALAVPKTSSLVNSAIRRWRITNNTTSKIVNLDEGKPPSDSALVSTTVYLQPIDSSTPIEISEKVLLVTNPPF
jgi:hypothetical protein